MNYDWIGSIRHVGDLKNGFEGISFVKGISNSYSSPGSNIFCFGEVSWLKLELEWLKKTQDPPAPWLDNLTLSITQN